MVNTPEVIVFVAVIALVTGTTTVAVAVTVIWRRAQSVAAYRDKLPRNVSKSSGLTIAA